MPERNDIGTEESDQEAKGITPKRLVKETVFFLGKVEGSSEGWNYCKTNEIPIHDCWLTATWNFGWKKAVTRRND